MRTDLEKCHNEKNSVSAAAWRNAATSLYVSTNEVSMGTIDTKMVRSEKFKKRIHDLFGAELTPIDNLPYAARERLDDAYKHVIYGGGDICDEFYISYLVMINTDFFMRAEHGHIGIFRYTSEQDYVIYLTDDVLSLLGNSASNWIPNVLMSNEYAGDIDKMAEFCSEEFGIKYVAFDPTDEDYIDFITWEPIIKHDV